jgi:hypothetical protein
MPFAKSLKSVLESGSAPNISRNASRNHERTREKPTCFAHRKTREEGNAGGVRDSSLFFGRSGAEAFLLDPADHIRWAILDGDVPGFCRAKKHHRFAIDKRDIRKIERHRLITGGFTGEQAFDFGYVLFCQLSAKPNLERLLIFSGWSDLQHSFELPIVPAEHVWDHTYITAGPGIDAY